MTRTLEQHDRDERQNQHAQIYTPTNYPLPTYQRKRLNKHKIPMRAYFPANYQVKRRKIPFPSLYDAQVYERKFKSEYLERQFYERLLKSEPFIEKLIKNKSDLSKLSTLSELLTLYHHVKKRAAKRSRRAREPSRIPLAFLRGLNKKNSMLKNFVCKKISKIEIPKSSKLHRYGS